MRNIVDPASLISKMWKKLHEWNKSNISLFSLFLGKPWRIKEFINPKCINLTNSYFVFYAKSFIVLKILLWKSSRKIWLKWHLKLFFLLWFRTWKKFDPSSIPLLSRVSSFYPQSPNTLLSSALLLCLQVIFNRVSPLLSTFVWFFCNHSILGKYKS